MARIALPLAAESYEAACPAAAAQRLVNLYPEASPEGAEFPFALYSTPGLRSFASVGSGPIRGLLPMGGGLWVVSGDELYSVDRHGSADLIGGVSGVGNVRMTTNGQHVVVCTSSHAYAADSTGITTLPEQRLCGATYQDGYALYVQAGTQRVWCSALDDLTEIPGAALTTADASYDNVVGIISDHRRPVVLKERTIEFYYNSGAGLFPFVREQAGFCERGCAAAGSISKANNRVLFLGDDLRVYALAGYQPQPISTPSIDLLIKSLASPQSVEAFVYSQRGHTFYVLSFSDACLVFDLTTGKWHERETKGAGRWRASCHAHAWGLDLVGDYATGDLYVLDPDTHTDAGDELIRSVVTPAIHASGDRAQLYDVHAVVDAGRSLSTGQGSDPKALLSWSDDDGRTWSNDRAASIGRMGEYGTRAHWTRLGQFRRRHLRISCSEPVPVAITGVYARMEGAAS